MYARDDGIVAVGEDSGTLRLFVLLDYEPPSAHISRMWPLLYA